jgi:hypothetical protein
VVDYALGSGHHATTFVTVLDLDAPRLLEHRLTFYAKDGSLEITPGHARRKDRSRASEAGIELDSFLSLKCLGCHATQLSSMGNSGFDPRSLIPNVTCERCHGPARDHVEAANRGANGQELSMPMGLGRWTPKSQIDLCGKCHRHPNRVPPERLDPDDPVLVRFQPIGLSQSRCYKESGGGLSCVSCHDPHARAPSDPVYYERRCTNCHQTSPSRPSAAAMQSVAPSSTSICPVSPSSGCLSCHMPKIDSGQHVAFADHWIRVRRAQSGR